MRAVRTVYNLIFWLIASNDPCPGLRLVKNSVPNSLVKLLCIVFFECQALGEKSNECFSGSERRVCTFFGPRALLGRDPRWCAYAKVLQSIDQKTTKRHNCESRRQTLLWQRPIWIRLVRDRDIVLYWYFLQFFDTQEESLPQACFSRRNKIWYSTLGRAELERWKLSSSSSAVSAAAVHNIRYQKWKLYDNEYGRRNGIDLWLVE